MGENILLLSRFQLLKYKADVSKEFFHYLMLTKQLWDAF